MTQRRRGVFERGEETGRVTEGGLDLSSEGVGDELEEVLPTLDDRGCERVRADQWSHAPWSQERESSR